MIPLYPPDSLEVVKKSPAVARASLGVVGKARGCTKSGSLAALNDRILGGPRNAAHRVQGRP
jgi:hypothetical protein